MLSRFVIAFLPRSKHLLILWWQSPSAKKKKMTPQNKIIIEIGEITHTTEMQKFPKEYYAQLYTKKWDNLEKKA